MTPTSVRRGIAVNPIPYWSKAGKSKEVFEEAFADFAKIGYSAVKADVPDGMKAQEYADWLGSYGLAPAISLFSSPFDETIDIADEVEPAKRFAGTQVELGLNRTIANPRVRDQPKIDTVGRRLPHRWWRGRGCCPHKPAVNGRRSVATACAARTV